MAKSTSSFEPAGMHPRWKGAVTVTSKGYVKVNVGKEHPLADKAGQCTLHLLVWVAAGNPPPAYLEAIHHRDEDKENNRLRNLELVDAVEHGKKHWYAHRDKEPFDDSKMPY